MSNLSAAQRSKVRRSSQTAELDPSEEGGELNIVPFLDIIINILIFVLATVSVTFITSIQSRAPSAGGGGVRKDQDKQALNLTVFITNPGISIKASGGNIASGCTGQGGGITIPVKSGQHDYVALTECALKLKKASPEFADETQFSVAANPDTDYQTIISVMDALRNAPNGAALFEEVNFKVPR